MKAEASYHNPPRCHHLAVYKLSCEQFDELREYAEASCQICRIPEAQTPRGKLVIDHLPGYGPTAVRGLLCDRCNTLMAKVDALRVRPTSEVFAYRYNAWFVRVVHPLGPNVYFRSRSAR